MALSLQTSSAVPLRAAFSQDSARDATSVSAAFALRAATTRGSQSCVRAGNATAQRQQWRSLKVAASSATTAEPAVEEASVLRVIISGAPASGKGTQCEEIVKKYGLAHISTGDLLRDEVARGTESGRQAKAFMDAGQLVPDQLVIDMVRARLSHPDTQHKGWLLDGFPRSPAQAQALEEAGVVPDVFLLLQVPDSILVDRVVGRRLDPETNRIYHLTFSPPESQEVSARLIQRSDDTEEKALARVEVYKQHVTHVVNAYREKLVEVDGNRGKHEVFADITSALDKAKTDKQAAAAGAGSEAWRGMPTRLNDIPHSREIRQYFYDDACAAAVSAVEAGKQRIKLECLIPELNPQMDVYRIGTLLELMRELAFTFARKGKRVKVCVQGSMGSGIFAGMPLQLAGTRRLLEAMDWGEEVSHRIVLGSVGAAEVAPEDDVVIIMAPQNAVGNCILDDLQAMVEAAAPRPVIILNPRLKDLPSAAGVMQVSGRAERVAFTETFELCYLMRLLYLSGTQYPILGALRMRYPDPYEIYKRVDISFGVERYDLMASLPSLPSSADISDAFAGKTPRSQTQPEGIWGWLSKVF
ncbi:hypothetical protein CLOM_g24595 [Closterium sp. NIES-68]|nr:hypothetical protein CLOM_g24595 [Closterium sp. NIES-68]